MEVPEEVKQKLKFTLVEDVDEVLAAALEQPGKPGRPDRRSRPTRKPSLRRQRKSAVSVEKM